MDLIDVLWRQDIDLGGLEDVSLMRELEKREEMRLHNKQEEVSVWEDVVVGITNNFEEIN